MMVWNNRHVLFTSWYFKKTNSVLVHFRRLHVKYVNHDSNMLEDYRALGGKIPIHESVLAAAVPEVKYKVPKKTDVVLLDVDGGAEAGGHGCGIIREY